MDFELPETAVPISNEFLHAVLGGGDRLEAPEPIFTKSPDPDEFYQYQRDGDNDDDDRSYKSKENTQCCCYCCGSLKKVWCLVMLLVLFGLAIGGTALYLASRLYF